MDISNQILEIRNKYNLSRKEFADSLGLGKEGIRIIKDWETKTKKIPANYEKKIKEYLKKRPYLYCNKPTNFTFIDLFSGIGGFRLAFQKLNGRCVFSSEINKFSQKTYNINFGEIPHGDISKINPTQIPDFDILLGGFPCQPFSQAGLGKGFDDTRGTLFFNIINILIEKKPKAFLLENVARLKTHNQGKTLKTIVQSLNKAGYTVNYQVLKAKDFGVPQNRPRLYIVGFNAEYFGLNINNYNFQFPIGNKNLCYVNTILDAYVDPKYTISAKLYEGHLNRKIKNKQSGKGFGFSLVSKKSNYTNTLSARYYKDGSEILVDNEDGNRPRRLTPRECARLQGFPDDFIIPVSDCQAYKQFGNSIAIPVVKAIGKLILDEISHFEKKCN